MNKKISQLHHAGFTLIEVMVSVSIFVIIITIGIGSLLTVNRALQKSRIERQSVDSLSYVMDTMTRRLRTGTEYVISQGEISFKEQSDPGENNNGNAQIIRFDRGVDDNDHGFIRMFEGSDAFIITPPEVNITEFNVRLIGNNISDQLQPMALISINAIIKNQKQESRVGIQTVVSQRPFEQQGQLTP